MIGKLRGKIDAIGESHAIIDVNGVGYEVQLSARTLRNLKPGEDVSLTIDTHVREDAIRLFGFASEVERSWFRRVLVGDDSGPIYYSEEDPDGEFHLTEADTWDEAYGTWQAEIDVARRNAAQFGLDGLSKGRSRHSDEPFSLRWIYTHMIEEYARHNGHADLVRERLDGATGD